MAPAATRKSPVETSNCIPSATIFETELGWTALVWQPLGLTRVLFGQSGFAEVAGRLPKQVEILDDLEPHQEVAVDRLQAYAAGQQVDFVTIELDDSNLTPFQAEVIRQCRLIPWGQTVSYMELAERAGSPRAARAVGNVMRNNAWPLIVPCHRVVASQGLGGYSARGGLDTKRRLLRQEGFEV